MFGRNTRERRGAKGSCLREDTKRVCARAKKDEASQEKRKRAAKSELLRENKTTKRELCVKKKIERREQSVAAFERNN